MAKTTVRKVPVKVEVVEAKPKASQREKAIAPTRASSPNRAAAGSQPKTAPQENSKGKYGLIFLGVLAVVVITALFLTRK
jgi:hypothetical protein